MEGLGVNALEAPKLPIWPSHNYDVTVRVAQPELQVVGVWIDTERHLRDLPGIPIRAAKTVRRIRLSR
jgi:hypothetical protein